MNSDPLRVLVTRPKHQAEELCQLINEQGWQAIRFPTIEINFFEHLQLPQLDNFSCLIFTSRNSVEAAFKHWHANDFKSKQLIAIGGATTKALESKGLENIVSPNGISNSEQLLSIPELQEPGITGLGILILSGKGGRRLLQETLAVHAKTVVTLALYERQSPWYDDNEIEQTWNRLPDALVLTSNEAVDNLINILNSTPYLQSAKQIPTIVMSQRNQEHVKQLGFHAKSRIAETTDVYGLICALKQCFEEEDRE